MPAKWITHLHCADPPSGPEPKRILVESDLRCFRRLWFALRLGILAGQESLRAIWVRVIAGTAYLAVLAYRQQVGTAQARCAQIFRYAELPKIRCCWHSWDS